LPLPSPFSPWQRAHSALNVSAVGYGGGGVFRLSQICRQGFEIFLREAEGRHDGIGHPRARIDEMVAQPLVWSRMSPS
jgi:hypothetical protein